LALVKSSENNLGLNKALVDRMEEVHQNILNKERDVEDLLSIVNNCLLKG